MPHLDSDLDLVRLEDQQVEFRYSMNGDLVFRSPTSKNSGPCIHLVLATPLVSEQIGEERKIN